MSVYKRGEIWWVKIQAGGEVIRRSSGSTKKREAQEFERELRQDVKHQNTRTSVRYYREAVLKWTNGDAPKSMFSHARNTRPYLDATPIHLIPKAANQMKLDMLEEGLKPTTINRRLAVVKRILHLAFAEWEWIDRPLAQKVIKLSEKGQAREIYLSKKEVTELVSNLGDEARSITLIAAFTGLRRGEILGLKKKHWKKPYIILDSKTKSGKPRAVPVIEEIHDCITPPFSITEYGLRKAFESARETINRPDIRFHDLRHTFASWLVQEPEIPLTTIRDLLGHSSLAVTSKYAHLRGDHLNLVKKALS